MRIVPRSITGSCIAAAALAACTTTQVETTQQQIAKAYAAFTLIKATNATLIATVPAVSAQADAIHAWEARIDAAFAAARAAGDVAAAYAALREAEQQQVTAATR